MLSAINTGWRNFARLLQGSGEACAAGIEASCAESFNSWKEKHVFAINGLLDMGIDDSGRYLLCASHDGRELFGLEGGERLAVDSGDLCAGIGGPEAEMDGIGALAGTRVAMYGIFGRQVSEEAVAEAAALEHGARGLSSALLAGCGGLLILGYHDHVCVLERE